MSDLRDKEQEENLMRYWQESIPDGPDPAQITRELAGKITQFDQKIFWRNFLEYSGGLCLLAWGGYDAAHGSLRGFATIVCVMFVMGYMWWEHRGLKPLDPTASVREHREAMLNRFDDQIQLLSRVKYWYLLPLYLPGVWQAVETWPHSPWVAVLMLAVVTAAFAGVAWLNEVLAVATLREARSRVEAMFEENKS